MATKKAPAVRKAAKKPPKKAMTPASSHSVEAGVDDPLKTMHEAAAAGALLWEDGPTVEATALAREDADAVDADDAVDGLPVTNLAAAVERALKMADPKQPYVKLYSTLIIAIGPRGAALVPWSAPGLDASSYVVDGKQLVRMLKAAGKDAEIQSTPEAVVIKYAANKRRFTLKSTIDVVEAPQPPATDDAASPWVAFDPTMFHLAANFTDPKIEPQHLSGVHLGPGFIAATDRHSFFFALDAFARPCGTVPLAAFDGINEVCYVNLDALGRFWVCVPSTGEYRMVVMFAAEYPNVRTVAQGITPTTLVTLNKAALQDVLKKMAIVQKKTSSVMIHIFADAAGEMYMELRAQNPSASAELVARLDVEEHLGDAPRQLKMFTSAENLARLCLASPSPTSVTLGFGDTPRDPVTLDASSYTAAITAMHA